MESAGVGSLFRVSSYSDNGGGNCVEAGQERGGILVRDTKDRERGALTFPSRAWRDFTARVRADRADRVG